MAAFDSKIFNSEVFGRYMERIPRVKQNKFLEAGILKTRNDIKGLFSAQSGGNYATVPMYGLIDGNPLNYDGSTDITASNTKTYTQSMVVVGRAKAWVERDFSGDITSADFMDNVAAQVSTYWDDVDQDTILSILKGVFAMSSNDFTTKHTTDITTETTKTAGITTLNSALQKASGDNKNIFKVAITHSLVSTNLENISAIEYLKYTDSKGVERDLGLATWNGRLVLIDDSVPVASVKTADGTTGVFTLTISTALASGDSFKITAGSTGEKTYTYAAGTTTATAQATAIAALYANDTVFTVASSAGAITFTQKANGTGAIPTIDTTGLTTGAAAVATTTAGVAPTYENNYTTYVLGDGAFDFCDCGVKTPYEMDRNPSVNGGQDTLYTRQRKLFAPRGISFTKSVMSSASPTDTELENGSNWALVTDSAGSSTINHKAIPIARIISRG